MREHYRFCHGATHPELQESKEARPMSASAHHGQAYERLVALSALLICAAPSARRLHLLFIAAIGRELSRHLDATTEFTSMVLTRPRYAIVPR